MPDTKSNAEIAKEIVDSSMFGYADNEIDKASAENPDVVEASYRWLTERVESALTSTQSSLAKQVLEEMSTIAGGNHGGGLIVVSRDAAVERLRDLFSRLNIRMEE